jgi:predicted ATP-binding protein involved in virulence
MRIQRLKLTNFRGFENLPEIKFDQRVILLFGWNGAGKTSLLDAIGKCLNLIISAGVRPNMDFSFSPEDILVGKSTLSISMSTDFNNEVKHLCVEMEGTTMSSIPDPSIFFAGFSEKDNLPVMAYYKTNREIEKMPGYNGPIADDRFETYDGSFSEGLNTFSELINWFKEKEDFENENKINKKDLSYEDFHLKVIRKALKLFLKDFGFDGQALKVRRGDRRPNFTTAKGDYQLVVQKNGMELSLSQLSSGERSLLLMAADIARRAAIANPHLPDPLLSEGIVLIDEIELHLHPKWQRAVIPALRNTFQNIQFIIATHSPQVLSSVLEVIMEDEKRMPDVQKQIEEYFSLIRNNQLVKAATLRAELEKQLGGSDDPELVKADILIRRKERQVTT